MKSERTEFLKMPDLSDLDGPCRLNPTSAVQSAKYGKAQDDLDFIQYFLFHLKLQRESCTVLSLPPSPIKILPNKSFMKTTL